MLWFIAEFSSIFHPTCHRCLQKLGVPGSILQEVGNVGGVVGRCFWGVAQDKKSPEFRCPEVGTPEHHPFQLVGRVPTIEQQSPHSVFTLLLVKSGAG